MTVINIYMNKKRKKQWEKQKTRYNRIAKEAMLKAIDKDLKGCE